MLGSNYHGQAYYGQGPAVGSTFILHSVSAAVTTVGSISTKLLITHAVSATVTAVGSITRQVQRSLSASVTTIGIFASQIVEGLNIRSASTKILSLLSRSTNPLGGGRATKILSNIRRTRVITTDE